MTLIELLNQYALLGDCPEIEEDGKYPLFEDLDKCSDVTYEPEDEDHWGRVKYDKYTLLYIRVSTLRVFVDFDGSNYHSYTSMSKEIFIGNLPKYIKLLEGLK